MENIAIIGAGEMGEWFAKFYSTLPEEKRKHVILSDSDEAKAQEVAEKLGVRHMPTAQAIDSSPEILLAASLEGIDKVLLQYESRMDGKVVWDIASVKNGIADKLQKTMALSYSAHPMWGGATTSIEGKNIIIVPTLSTPKAWYKGVLDEQVEFFRDLGAVVTKAESPRQHDEWMAVSLALYHFQGIVGGLTVAQCSPNRDMHDKIIGTTATLADVSLESVVHSNPKLYAEIAMRNPYFKDVMKAYASNVARLMNAVETGDRDTFAKMMTDASDYFRGNRPLQEYLPKAKGEFVAAVNSVNTQRMASALIQP